MTAWKDAGWKTPPRNGREWKALRAGGKEPVRRSGRLPPCRACGKCNFSLQAGSDGKGGRKLYRKCLVCENRRAFRRRYDPVAGPKFRAIQAASARRRRAAAKEESHVA